MKQSTFKYRIRIMDLELYRKKVFVIEQKKTTIILSFKKVFLTIYLSI